MPLKKRIHPVIKVQLHPRNKHRERYDFHQLTVTCPELGSHIKLNEYRDESIDFSDPQAVLLLNKALLEHYYNINYWTIPPGYLCPSIPGRADYIHYIADLLENDKRIDDRKRIKCLDIGVGASCVYPIIGSKEYEWFFVGSDIDPVAIASANHIIVSNPQLINKIEIRLQSNPNHIFKGIIQPDDFIDVTICNPPFHSSAKDALSGTQRKLRNLKMENKSKPILNFGGIHNELWCTGGEERFINKMILESKLYSTSCLWFSTLVSKESHLKKALSAIEQIKAELKIIPMAQGNKISRILAWTFNNKISC